MISALIGVRIAVPTLLLLVLFARSFQTIGGVPDSPRSPPPQASSRLQPGFPRVATIYSKTAINTDAGKRAIARFQLYVTDFGWWDDRNYSEGVPRGWAFGQYLKHLNPALITLVYHHSSLFEDGSWKWRPGQSGYLIDGVPYHIDLAWFLTYPGSTLAGPLSATSTQAPVTDLARFEVDGRVIIGALPTGTPAEMARVVAKSADRGPGTLTLERGLNAQNGRFPAIDHPAGAAIRPVAYAFGDKRVLVMNVTETCPRTLINPTLGHQTWNEFSAAYLAAKLAEPLFSTIDGVFLDNVVDDPAELVDRWWAVDLYGRNEETSLDARLWADGMTAHARLLRQRLGSDRLIVANHGGDPMRAGRELNGGMIEGLNQVAGSSLFPNPWEFYRRWIEQAVTPPIFLVNGSTATTRLVDAEHNYQAMRFLLTWTLMSDGFFVYDEFLTGPHPLGPNGGGHQTTWWYDEYDNAGQGTGYLGQPLGEAVTIGRGVSRRDFDHGIALVNASAGPVTVVLETTYRKIRGQQAPTVNDGSLVRNVTLPAWDGIILLRASSR